MQKDIMFVIGTRPELIKVAPVIMELRNQGYQNYTVVNTGQHRELLNKYWKVFGITPDHNLDVIFPNQDLSSLTARAITQINDLLKELRQKGTLPKLLLAQGDTTTVMAASLVSFYNSIPFVHLEAGLRSHDLYQPFPEEFNRRVAGIVAACHLAPTELAKENIARENHDMSKVQVAGNTVIDALRFITASPAFEELVFTDLKVEQAYHSGKELVLITCHRRENQNENLTHLMEAVDQLARENSDTYFIWPLHANPNVKNRVLQSNLNERSNVVLTDPMDYLELVKTLAKSKMVLTDSGGIQEEAPSFKVPVLVLRDKTERPEAVLMGVSAIVGCDKQLIIDKFNNFRPVFADNFVNPYGDGKAAARIVSILLQLCNGISR